MNELHWLDDIYFEVLSERIQLDAELVNKDDDTLVEDLLYASDHHILPDDCEEILTNYTGKRKLSKANRNKLEGLYKLIYGKECLGVLYDPKGNRELL